MVSFPEILTFHPKSFISLATGRDFYLWVKSLELIRSDREKHVRLYTFKFIFFYKGNWEFGKIHPHSSKKTQKAAPNPWVLLNMKNNYIKDLHTVRLSEIMALVSQ